MKKRILFIYLQPTPFVEEDRRLLSRDYDLRCFSFDSNRYGSRLGKLWGLGKYGLMQFFFLIREAPSCDLIYGWFADYHLVIPVWIGKLLRKPVTVCVAGFDAISIPDHHYGGFTKKWRAWLIRFVYRYGTLFLPVSETLIRSENSFLTWPSTRENGILVNVPGFDRPVKVIPFGFDALLWRLGPSHREPSVLTVGSITSVTTLRRKGIDLLIAVARELPEVDFKIVGVHPEMVRYIKDELKPGPNITLVGPVPRLDLVGFYGTASVYAQLSFAEGLPNVLCEAMLCGCIPVGSDVFGITDAIGDTGYLVDRRVPQYIASIMRQALEAPPDQRLAVRRRIADHFSLSKRHDELVAVIEVLIQPPAKGKTRLAFPEPRSHSRQQ